MADIKIMSLVVALCVASSIHADDLSEGQIMKIANQYVEACISKDYDAWRSLLVDIGDITRAEFTGEVYPTRIWIRPVRNIKKIKIKEIDGLNVRVEIFSYSNKRIGWLQLLPDGKIKYDAITYQHPIAVAFDYQARLSALYRDDYNGDTRREYRYSEPLLESGIPVFGLKKYGKPNDQLRSLKQIKEWLLNNGGTWDRSEPKLACPEDQFKELFMKYK